VDRSLEDGARRRVLTLIGTSAGATTERVARERQSCLAIRRDIAHHFVVRRLRISQCTQNQRVTVVEGGRGWVQFNQLPIASLGLRQRPASDFDGSAADGTSYAHKFSGKYSHRILKGIGHNEPQEAPQAFAEAVVEVDGY